MSTVYSHADDKVSVRTIEAGQPLPAGAIWVDMLHPTEEERAAMSAAVGTTLPTQEDMMEIEASSRIYQDGGTSFLTASVVAQADTVKPETGPLTFVLTPRLLITLRFVDPNPIRIFSDIIRAQHHLCATPRETLLVFLRWAKRRVGKQLD